MNKIKSVEEQRMLAEQEIQSFCKDLMSKSPVPGGGGVSALAGALAACLGGMAIQLTMGKKKFASIEQTLEQHLQNLEINRQALLACMDEDAAAFEPLSKAYGMPADTDKQKAEKRAVLECCLCRAAEPPMKILNIGAQITETLCALSGNTSKLVISDLGCAAAMARACAQCAAMNVWVNAQLMKDQEKAQQLYMQSNALLQEAVKKCDALTREVETALCR